MMIAQTMKRASPQPGLFAAAARQLLPHWSLWAALLVLFVVNMAWIAITPRFDLSARSYAMMALVLLGSPLVLIYGNWRSASPDPVFEKLLRLALVALFAGLFTQQVNLYSHLGMSLALPLADGWLIAWDRALGFDWNAYALATISAPGSRIFLFFAYALSIGPALALILGIAVWTGRHDRVNELAFLAVSTGFVCVTIAALLPAEAAWVTLAGPEVKALLGGAWPPEWLEQFHALRSGGPVTFDLRSGEGLATFPSFHTCLGLLILWCSRGHWLGLLAGSLTGLAIIAATPVFGGHYAVDLLAGFLVMGAAVLAWHRPWRRRAKPA